MAHEPSTLQPAALVTGGARRIGCAIVRALARAGYAVAVHAHASGREARRLADEVTQQGGHAVAVHADLADPSQLKDLVPTACAALGPLTLLVNNASMFERDDVGGLDRARWDRQVAVNLTAPVFLAEAFTAQLPAGAEGLIVNVTDQRVFKPTPHFVSYTLSKGALHLATTTLAQALAPRIRVNAVAPGPTLPSPRQSEADFARQSAAVPLGRGPSPEEVAEAVLYLAAARSVTGQTIAVDGGQHVSWRTADILGVEE